MVVMRCISVQQIVRSDIQAGRKILQQLNRAAAASRFNFCKMVRTNVRIILSCSCVILCFFRKSRIRPPNSFASNRIVQSFPLRRKHKQAETPFPSPGLFSAWKCTMTATRWAALVSSSRSITAFNKLVSKTSICLSLQRNHIKFSTFFTGLIFTIPRKKLNTVSV